jgi:succinoglycan biosynthesis protein ExoU
MTSQESSQVCVIVAAYNSASTIGRAVGSALAQREVAEVVVVDDASTDNTAEAAQACDDETGRLRVIRCETNTGPATARNTAIAASTAPLIAILDADDFFLPRRFESLLATPDWDLLADNIVFVAEKDVDAFDQAAVRRAPTAANQISLTEFVEGNRSRAGKPRGELGFAKPVIRRSALERHGLAYDADLRLGEDYALYCRLLTSGSRFLRVGQCGYVAVERTSSLSGQHRSEDLAALLAFDDRFLDCPSLTPAERQALIHHRHELAAKVHHREMLDVRQRSGRLVAFGASLARPMMFPALVQAIAQDKRRRPPVPSLKGMRYLFD